MFALSGGHERGPSPLQLPIGEPMDRLPVPSPGAPVGSDDAPRPPCGGATIEIDLVITDDDSRKHHHDRDHDDGDPRDRPRGSVIEISLV